MSSLDLLNAVSLPYPVSREIISIPTFSSLLLGHSDLLQSGSEHFACLFLPHPDSLFSSPSAAFCIQKKVLSLICVHTCRPMHNFFLFPIVCVFSFSYYDIPRVGGKRLNIFAWLRELDKVLLTHCLFSLEDYVWGKPSPCSKLKETV